MKNNSNFYIKYLNNNELDMQNILYCCECFNDVAEKDSLTFDILTHICETYINKGKPFVYYFRPDEFNSNFARAIQELEERRFVVTTENCFESIKIKPLNIITEEFNGHMVHSVCFNRGDHSRMKKAS